MYISDLTNPQYHELSLSGLNKKLKGWSLQEHTTSSTLVGYDSFGKQIFDTTRPKLAQLFYEIKYRSDDYTPQMLQKANEIIKECANFLNQLYIIWGIVAIIPTPPSKDRGGV